MRLSKLFMRVSGWFGLMLALAISVSTVYAAPSVIVTESGGSTNVTEGGATDTYTVVLGELPLATVTITLTPSPQYNLSSTSLTFTVLNWNTAQTVTVTAVNDAVDETSPHTATILHSASGGGYTGVTIPDVTVNITDNDTRGVTIVESGGTTTVTEGGATDTYTVVLTSQPTASVTITLTPDAQVSVSPTSLNFTTGNWNTAQTVTVTAVNDDIDEASPHTGTITHSAAGGDYVGVTIASVSPSITDNDTRGVTITQSGGTTTVTEGGATDTYTVVLTSQPTASVTITLTPDAQVSVSPTSLNFTTGNWNTAQTVTVTAVNDDIDEASPHTGTITHSAAGGDYVGVTIASVSPSITDNDTRGVTITQSGGTTTVTEGGATDTYTVVLTSEPTADVTITLTPNAQITTDVPTLTFTPANWDTAQTVTVTAVNDDIDEASPHTGTITHSAAGGDYVGVTIASVSPSITDNDTRGVTVTETASNTAVDESGAITDTYTVMLTSEPTADVTITLTPNAQITTDVPTLTFTPANWDTAQTVTVTAVNDDIDEASPHTGIITHSAAGGDYVGVTIANLTVDVNDNDTRGVTITESGGTTLVAEGGATDTYTVVLTSEPTADVTITLTPDAQVTTNVPTLTFTPSNWDTAQTVTVTAFNDAVVETSPHSGTITHSSAGGDYVGVTITSVTADITDNDVRGVTITESAVTTSVIEGGATDTYTVVLTSLPTADVTITITPNAQVSVSPITLTFTTGNWNVAQTVTITAVNDAIDEATPHSGLITHSAAGGDYAGVTIANLSVSVGDNDTRGITLVQTSSSTTVTEGGVTDTYTIRLNSEPTADVTIDLTPDAQVGVSPSSLTFTSVNWNTNQTVTVSAVDDFIDEAATHAGNIAHTVSTGSSDYNGLGLATLPVTVTDNDTAGVTRSKTTVNPVEGGANDTYTLVLDSQPTADVTLTLTQTTQFTVSPASLTFTTVNWNTPQLVTVSAVDDLVDEADPHSGGNITHSAVGGGYDSVTIANIAVSVSDNDTAGVTITESGGATTVAEGGATDSYTVVLNTQPSGTVTFTPSPDAQVTVSPTSLTFTTLNWNVAQTITVTADNDNDNESAHTGTITHAATGGGYNSVVIAPVVADITDNDVAGLTITPSGGSIDVAEGGATDTFTVVLNTRPSAQVTVTLTGNGVTLSPTSLSFPRSDWNIAQTVTVTAINDLIDETSPHAGSVSFSTAGGGYVSVVTPDSSVNITDNDTAGVTITQSGGTTNVTEGSATDTYTVVLDTQPTADVTVTVIGDAQATGSPSPLTFTPLNWNVAQTVTVTAVNDAVVEGAHAATLTHSASGGGYTGVTIASVGVTISDNDLGSLVITPTSVDVTEGSITDTYTVALGAQPSGTVTVTLTPDSQVTTDAPTLTFTALTWNIAQTVTVSAVNDVIVEAAHSGSVSHSASGGAYVGVTGATVAVNITDNDAGGAVIVQSGGTTDVAEQGLTSDTYTLALSAQPSGSVTVTITAGVLTSVSPTTLTFSTVNWNIPQTVTVTALNNFIDNGDFFTDTIAHAASGGGYTGAVLPNLSVSVEDNDIAGVIGISLLPVGNIITEGGNTDGFQIRLSSEPLSPVTLGIAQTDDYTVSPLTMTFTPENWRDYQEVIITAVDDGLLEGTEIIPITVPSIGSPGYNGTFVGLEMTVVDNDATITPDVGDGLVVTEGIPISDSYSIAMNITPVAGVTTTVSSTQCRVSADDNTFGPDALITLNGTTPVNVFIRSLNDDVAEGTHTCTLTHAPTVSSDPSYNGMSIGNVIATVNDNDTAGVTLVETGGTTALVEGGLTDSFTVSLTSQPTANVTVNISQDADSSISPTTLTFTPANWDDAQTVTITATDDRVVEGAHSTTISLDFVSGDAIYDVLARTIIGSVADNDSAEILFTDTTAANLENVGSVVRTVFISYSTGGSGDFGLDSALTVQLSTSNGSATNDDYQLDVTSVTFPTTAANNTTRNYSYTLVNDSVAEGEDTFNIQIGSASSANSAMLARITANDSLPVTILNDDNAGIVIDESGGSSTVTEGSLTDDYTVRLGTQPTGTVTIEITTAQVTVSPTTLTFTVGDWDTPQAVTITAIDDLISEGSHSGTITHTASGGGYSGALSINVTINDNDSQGVIVNPATVTVVEGGVSDAFTVVLTSQPSGSVTITMNSTQATATPSSLTFTTTNWNVAQSVTVNAIDDGLVEGNHLSLLTLTPSGGGYGAVVIEDVDVNIFDNDAEGFNINTLTITATEGGANGTYTVALLTQPPSPVTVTLTGDAQITLSPPALTFTDTNWNIAQTVTVTAVADGVLEGDHASSIAQTVTSADPAYDGMILPNVSVSIVDGVSELLVNGGFEIAGDTAESAASWTGKKLVAGKDQRVCNTIENPALAFEGTCAFQFSAPGKGAAVARKITQAFTSPTWGIKNNSLTLSAQVTGIKAKSGGKLTLQIIYIDGSKQNVSVTIPTGTYAYTLRTRSVTLQRRVKKVTVVLTIGKAGGTVLLDAVSLALTPKSLRVTRENATGVLSLPPAP